MPDQNTQAPVSSLLDNTSVVPAKPFIFTSKGLMLALVFVIGAGIIAVITLFNFGSASDYQGMIKKVENETQLLQDKTDIKN